jgi:hypothetical protein
MKKLWIALFTVFAFSSVIANNFKWSSPPTTLSTATVNASTPQIASDGSGDLVAVWAESGLVKVSTNVGGGGWSSAVTLSTSGASSPCVVSDSSGNLTAIWNQAGLIQAKSHPSGGSWSSATTISSSGSASPTLAVDGAGNVVAAWVSSGGQIHASSKLFGGSWSAQATISSGAGTLPFVAMGGSGSNATAVIVWQGTSGSISEVLVATKLTSSGSWGAQVVISDTTQSAGYAHAAVDAKGNATAVWYKYNLVGTAYYNVTVSSVTRPQGGSWSAFGTISASGMMNPASLVARVSYDTFGNAIAVWNNSYDGATFNVESAVKPLGSVWSNPIVAVTGNDYAYEVDLAVCTQGDAISTYMFYNGQYLFIRASENDITGFIPSAWTVPVNIGLGTNNGFPRLAATLSGNTIYAGALWLTQNGSNINVVAVTGTKVLVGAPTSPSVAQSSNNLGVSTEYVNTVSWTASTDPNAAGYLIYRNGIFIGQVDADTTSFVDHNQTASTSVTYGIATVDAQQSHSKIVSVSL